MLYLDWRVLKLEVCNVDVKKFMHVTSVIQMEWSKVVASGAAVVLYMPSIPPPGFEFVAANVLINTSALKSNSKRNCSASNVFVIGLLSKYDGRLSDERHLTQKHAC